MVRYKVTIVTPGGGRPVLLVPFQPDALVTAFIDELFKRIGRLNLDIKPDTHVATLHLDSETGALLDCEDLLSDVIGEGEREKLFMVLKAETEQHRSESVPGALTTSVGIVARVAGDHIRVRVVTPARARKSAEQKADHFISVPTGATLRELHQHVASHLGVPAVIGDTEVHECNCKLASKLAEDSYTDDQFLVVHGKSQVQRLELAVPTEIGVKQSLRFTLGSDLETRKKIVFLGGTHITNTPNLYKNAPVVAICSKQRHIPAHARVDLDDTYHTWTKVLDLSSVEQPLHPACMDVSVEQSGLLQLAEHGILTIFAVNRSASGANNTKVGKNAIYRARSHWHPTVKQSDRGMAMFLSSLRVFVSVAQDMSNDERAQDALLHTFDLLSRFPPALRTLYILIQDRTPSPVECAALSQAIFEMLDSFMPVSLIGSNQDRLFEGSRLAFGFILESAKSLKLSAGETVTPYLSSFGTVDLRDFKTLEPVFRAANTDKGTMELALFEAFQGDGVLARSHLQDFAIKIDNHDVRARLSLLSAGQVAEMVTFSSVKLHVAYTYKDAGDLAAAIDLSQLSELDHLAELSGRNKLAVHRPSQLTSAVTPCLTFDSAAHLGVYLGEEGCALPGQSTIVFRPLHGQETVDRSVVEQTIAPVLRQYEADGTAVFDALGGAAVRRMRAPEEILMFYIDCSSSMREDTEFDEVNDPVPLSEDETDARTLIEPLHYTVSLDDVRDCLCNNEGFHDMIGIVAEARSTRKRQASKAVLEILRGMLSSQIRQQTAELEDKRQRAYLSYHARNLTQELETELGRTKQFFAGLHTHETALEDFLMYRAQRDLADLSKKWAWSLSDPVPTASGPGRLPTLEDDITTIPDDLRCPISHQLKEDAVTAADGFDYARAAISEWFQIRRSSPMTGLPLNSTTLQSNQGICDLAASWIRGDDLSEPDLDGARGQLPPTKRDRPQTPLEVVFDSRTGSFRRSIAPSLSLKDLYKLAFRGLRGRHHVFQLSSDSFGTLSPLADVSVAAAQITNGTHISIRIAEDEPTSLTSGQNNTRRLSSAELCLVKVYANNKDMSFAFWSSKSATSQTLATVIWKYWRYRLSSGSHNQNLPVKQVWTDLTNIGDGHLRGSPRNTTDRLAKYFTPTYCFGRLTEEKVFRDDDAADFSRDPLVLKVKVNDQSMLKRKNGRLTRLCVLKQMLEALINRLIAYNYRTHVGLTTVRSTAHISMPISHVVENLRRATNDMQGEGDTALWDGLALAKAQIEEYAKQYPQATKRIVCISDGEDTKSATHTAPILCWQMREAGIAVDTVALGNEDNVDLRTLSHLLGCYQFQPKSLVNALAMCEMDPFLSLSERPTINPPSGTPRAMLPFLEKFRTSRYHVRATVVTEDQVPPIKKHPNWDDEVIELAAVASRPAHATVGAPRSNFRTVRLMNEMKALMAGDQHSKYDVYVSESNIAFWKVIMEGPDGSPYAGGTFLLWLCAEDGYPTFPPKARFMTAVKHPNITSSGRICHQLLSRDWTSDISMRTVLDTIYSLLYQPEHSDPVNTTITLGYHHDEVEFADQVRAHVQKHAAKSRVQWRADLLGENERAHTGLTGNSREDGDLEDPSEWAEEDMWEDESDSFE